MLLVNGWHAPPEARGATVTLGNFDGMHRGHAHLLRAAHAARPDARLGIVSFEPHPRELFRPDDPPFRLSNAEERAEAAAALGVSVLFELAFDEAFSRLPAERFVDEVLHGGIGAAHLSCGPSFAFGHRRGGDTTLLAARAEALGMGLAIVQPLTDEEGPVSSTRIRRALQDGYPERASALLGRDWSISGIVSHGDKRGRTIGFPTANLSLGRHLEPARGVYAVHVGLGDGRVVPGVANIGRRPTVAGGAESRVEAHLFDFDADLYGQLIVVSLHAFLRAERKFGSFEELAGQIRTDAEMARAALG